MDGLVPGDNEKDVNPSTRSFFQMPYVRVLREWDYRFAWLRFRRCGLRW
jgi:hypothetical protein